ncbi:hypothetical protein ILUMI_02754 [Ignelater luminosus]|uniref:Uncharacterized protein n=1 Tax=Ignelater luminosus TaxID=2038154 RepID=A0A8K0DC72_IGNLU|nr:hypothetical protein ILUMI_02754 [Ignelater luminosus]
MEKRSRDHMTTPTTDSLVAVHWNDNNVVTVLSNCDSVYPIKHSNRYSRSNKKKVREEKKTKIISDEGNSKDNCNELGLEFTEGWISCKVYNKLAHCSYGGIEDNDIHCKNDD